MSSQFARLRGALDRVGTTTPGTVVGVFAEDLTAIMNHYVEVVREAAELKAARAQPAQAVPVLTDAEIHAADPIPQNRFDQERVEFARAVEAAVRAKMGAVPMTDPQLQTSEERRATGERIMALATSELSDLVRRARAIVVGHQRGSISLVQRHLQISYNTAAKLLEALEQEGVVSPQRQNGQREVLVLPNISGIVGKEGA